MVFHFQMLLENFERTVIDDSHKTKVLAEIFVGKMFKMEVWETLLTYMRIGEVAEFWSDAVEEEGKKGEEEEEEKEDGAQDESKETEVKKDSKDKATVKDETANKKAESSPETQSETNQSSPSVGEGMDWQQKLRHIMFLQKEGNVLLTEKYSEATGKSKRLWNNFKAVYQQARAHLALCNEQEARKDFQKVEHLEPKFKPTVNQENKRLDENLRNKHVSNNKNNWEATVEKWGPELEKVKKPIKFQEEEKGPEGSGGSDGVREEKKQEGKGEEGSVKTAATAEKEGGSGGVKKEKASGKRRECRGRERWTGGERSGKAVIKAKCQSTAAHEVTKGSTGNKGTNETRSSTIQSESTNRSPLTTSDLPNRQATEVLSEVAEERVRLDTQMVRPNKGEAEESKMDKGRKTEGEF
ncbi:unnamed protein product [Coregonus sp. 'balchen']|nr:unnamed protein product [Coregonus sp. 'balchen']